ncbi:sulfatase-like hydrolase/transferase [Ruegeria lacuscaerulensis]|uniref:sulfatase-like hydrolase/transferase n=1 Tax=Ruegeria lacuscaerulensis TaxID=55218 RepID=UPI00147FA6E4|nr:sulfatase-like hydrolase/transferase [Ruegeria lacuscaerulensis]
MVARCFVLKATVAAVLASTGSAVSAQDEIVHDAEFTRMEQEFGAQWGVEDEEVATKLAALEERFGKKPNIVYILADDVGYTELGSYGGGKIRGAPTNNLDRMAEEGMRFLSFYSEVECSPSRGAVMTGRHPIRNGLYNITLPGEVGRGLHGEEVTIAEILSEAGYYTGFFGKWHMGEDEEHFPTNQGFDEAEWSEGNPPWWVANWEASADEDAGGFNNRGMINSPGPEGFPYDNGGVMRARRGETPEMVYRYSLERYNTYDSEVADNVIDFIERRAKSDQPFFVNFWGKGNHFWGAHPDFRDTPAQSNTSAQMVEHDYNVGRVIKTLVDLGIAENTLVIWNSDNGPMYTVHPHGGYSLLPGTKGETREGGIRVPAVAWWPGMIEAGQDPLDLVQITDWFMTMARLADAEDYIPTDRVIDGVDQSGLLLLGEGAGRRDYIFHYNRDQLEAVRKDQVKMNLKPNNPDFHFYEMFNIYHDPAERFPNEIQNGLWAGPGLTKMIQDHFALIQQFPHRVLQGHYRDFDRSFDPEPTPVYTPQKTVDW